MSIETVLINALGEPERNNKGDMIFICPFCRQRIGKTKKYRKLYVNLHKGLVHCFRCDYAASFLIPFFVDIFGPTFDKNMLAGLGRATIRDGRKLSEIVVERLSSFQEKDIFSSTKFYSIDLPDEFKLLSGSDTWFAKKAKTYLKRRGLTERQIQQHQICYAMEGRYRHMLVFPVYKNNSPVYFITRGVGNDERKLNPSLEECEYGKERWVYNYDAIKNYEEVILVEGVMDCLTTGENCGAIFGKAMSPYQLTTLLDLPAQKFTIMMDEDARDKTLEIADAFRGLRDVNVVLLDKGDPNQNRGQINRLLDTKSKPSLTQKVRSILR